jgi:predicted nucleotidyltransferase
MNKDTIKFLEELKNNENVLGVILFGSWARGNNRPDSDVDLVVIIKEGYMRTVEYKNNQAFEIIYTTEKSALDFWESKIDDCFNLWSVAKIVYDKDGAIKELEVKAQKIIKEGKKKIDAFQVGQFKFSAEDELRAVELTLEKDKGTASLVLSKTTLSLTEHFFDLRQLWTPAPKQRLAKIKEVNPELGELFNEFYDQDVPLINRIEIAKKIIPIVFGSK